ncbi:CheR family methyltransferase [Thalassolituus maritimus]|uniref:protein-glutamate O-methyltransferase n=1 Tax=Thalassolituus maritimus TaxID=484498 RepID=A0ABQ0A0P1_9GAMM
MTREHTDTQLSGTEYEQFRQRLEALSGILLGDGKEYLVVSRLRKIMRDKGLPSLTELMYCMERDRQFQSVVVDAMTTNETLWLRDGHPFEILSKHIYPALAEQGSPIRIWSSACSTGQEPYSIKLTELDFRQQSGQRLPAVSILATDLSDTALEAAKQGRYPWMAIRRGMPEIALNKYFEKTGEDEWCVGPELRAGIDFRNFNLNDSYTRLGNFDVIFCRNVLIYFSSERKREILQKMHAALKPGGFLILGASEALSGLANEFEMISCNPGIMYRKK